MAIGIDERDRAPAILLRLIIKEPLSLSFFYFVYRPKAFTRPGLFRPRPNWRTQFIYLLFCFLQIWGL